MDLWRVWPALQGSDSSDTSSDSDASVDGADINVGAAEMRKRRALKCEHHRLRPCATPPLRHAAHGTQPAAHYTHVGSGVQGHGA